ncbi:MAG: gamma carbonic anhydrase family protein [Verrucomicrobiota bacterium]
MSLHPYLQFQPKIDPSAFIAPSADLIGRVTVEEKASIWYGAVLRGDIEAIHIGAHSNVQDGSVIHLESQRGTHVGEYVTVGHKALLHACEVQDECLIGMGAIVMDHSVIGEQSLVAAGTLVLKHTIVPPGSLVLGSPARVVRPLSPEERASLKPWAEKYVRVSRKYLDRKSASPSGNAS